MEMKIIYKIFFFIINSPQFIFVAKNPITVFLIISNMLIGISNLKSSVNKKSNNNQEEF